MTSGEGPRRIVVGITGASGSILGVRVLERLREQGVESHLVLSKWGARTLQHETAYSVEEVRALASVHYPDGDLGAAIASGSFLTDGMVIVPCSMRTVAAIASGMGDNLIHRAADVTIKERRKLVAVAREMPLSEIHLENLLKLARLGASIVPPVPAFYNHPQTVEAVVDHIVARVLDQIGVHVEPSARWEGGMTTRGGAPAGARWR